MSEIKRERFPVRVERFDIVPVIEPLTYYTTGQIIKLGLLPGLYNTHQSRTYLNRLITDRLDGIRYPALVTTERKIKSVNAGKIGETRAMRKVQGMELIKFLKLHNALPK